jgi:hypothetical protein
VAPSRTPPTNYYQNETDILKVAENVSQVFMGMRSQCAQCHNHPFDRWTMDDYYGFAAFFSQIGRKGTDDPRETIVFNSKGGEVVHPIKRLVMEPRFLGGAVPDLKGEDRRVVLAKWLASPDNPYFATNLANRVWQHFFGIGIIEAVDDVRISNPASNPELLAELGKRFTAYKYDFKKLVREICTSRTYRLATRTNPGNEGDTRNFGRAYLRRIKAETFLDCINQVTETKNKFPGSPVPRPAPGRPRRPYRRRRYQHLLPQHLWPGHPRDCLLLRGPPGADVIAVLAPAQRRHDDAEDHRRQPDRQAPRREERRPGDRGAVHPLPQPQTHGR